ncbi:hypothetical protein D3C86_1858210 [compost metagenome]
MDVAVADVAGVAHRGTLHLLLDAFGHQGYELRQFGDRHRGVVRNGEARALVRFGDVVP